MLRIRRCAVSENIATLTVQYRVQFNQASLLSCRRGRVLFDNESHVSADLGLVSSRLDPISVLYCTGPDYRHLHLSAHHLRIKNNPKTLTTALWGDLRNARALYTTCCA